MSNRALHLVAFLAPIVGAFLFPFFVFITSGEHVPIEDVVAIQERSPATIFGRAYSDVDGPYKLAMLSERHADVVVVGSSRAMYFRGGLFSPSSKFLNAGGVARELYGLQALFDSIGGQVKPKVVIVALDQRWFRADYTSPHTYSRYEDPTWGNFWNYSWKKIYQD